MTTDVLHPLPPDVLTEPAPAQAAGMLAEAFAASEPPTTKPPTTHP